MADRRDIAEHRQAARQRGAQLDAEHSASDPFAAAIRSTRMSMLITDPRQNDNPIVFVNAAFEKLTGFRREDIIGTNCDFFKAKIPIRRQSRAFARRSRPSATSRSICSTIAGTARRSGTRFT